MGSERPGGLRVSMLLHKSAVHDSRVRREAEALHEAGHAVTVIELIDDVSLPLRAFTRVSVAPPRWVRHRLGHLGYRIAFSALFVARGLRTRPQVVHAHDAAMLLPGLVLATLARADLVYDSHELATGVPYRDHGWGAFVATLERLIVPRCTAVITVSDGIADRLRQRYRLRRRPVVLRNVCSLPRGTAPVPLRARLGLTDEPLVVHQGAAAKDRGCEVLLRAVARLPGVHLCLLGDGDPAILASLRASARGAHCEDRLHVLPSVPSERLLALTADADVGVSLLQDTCENHRLALPNKLFEYLHAGLPVVVSALPEMRALVERYGVGWTVPPHDERALAEALRIAVAHRADAALGVRVQAAARELSWSAERGRLVAAYESLR